MVKRLERVQRGEGLGGSVNGLSWEISSFFIHH